MSQQAIIFGLSGPTLSENERVFFRDVNPWGFILFARNIETPDQVRRLTDNLKACTGRPDVMIFVDQEGGRVQRFTPPHWPIYPAAIEFSRLHSYNVQAAKRALYLNYRLIADDLHTVGVNANCAPVLDIPVIGSDPIISDRAFGERPAPVIELAHAAMAGLLSGGIAPVIKHMPGHGRAKVDSHKTLPHIDTDIQALRQTDFRPFQALLQAPMAMTAHAIYNCVDTHTPLTISPKAVREIIREDIGFDGLLMSDDLDMKALSGTLTEKTQQTLAAGCDIALQCSGRLTDMVQVAKGAKALSGVARARADIAQYCIDTPEDFDRDAAVHERNRLLSQSSVS